MKQTCNGVGNLISPEVKPVAKYASLKVPQHFTSPITCIRGEICKINDDGKMFLFSLSSFDDNRLSSSF